MKDPLDKIEEDIRRASLNKFNKDTLIELILIYENSLDRIDKYFDKLTEEN
jgi:hypothetical protein